MTGFPINPPRAAISDGRGFVSPEWYRYFAQIQSAVGSSASATWQDGFLLVPPPLSVLAADMIEGGGAAVNVAVRTVVYDTTVQANDCVLLCDATSSDISVVLPASASSEGRTLHIKKIDASANTVDIAGVGGDTIDGAASKSLAAANDSYMLTSDGLGWYAI